MKLFICLRYTLYTIPLPLSISLYELVRNQSENAVMAAKAYESIVNAINKARKSAEQALNDAKVSKKIVSNKYITLVVN